MMRGGMNNMQGMMNKMKKMQKEMQAAQAQLQEMTFEGSASNDLVTVKISGEKEVLQVKVDPDILDPEDAEMIGDLIMIATNEALAKVDEATEQTMGKYTQGFNIPGF
ncbi:YbaB/EbfC family nucleoid-associated protein [Allofustis seminis]|uniref:YbaB/EbfC family nucleoid-associated protein n=1 Tax=Allofustis seminis TaxID=166939 RepID=UPI000374E496|nr:YbaB/EbfC family nucleoid-associated protein [Allofustis seminis]